MKINNKTKPKQTKMFYMSYVKLQKSQLTWVIVILVKNLFFRMFSLEFHKHNVIIKILIWHYYCFFKNPNSILYIRKTCPCNEYPLKPHFYIEKLGFVGVYLFFLFLLQNIDCGYSLEPPRRGGSNVYPQSMF